MAYKTSDICDVHASRIRLAAPIFRTFGLVSFSGPIATVRVFDDNVLVRATFGTPGRGRVLVVDAAASLRCAMIGDRLAKLGLDNGWVGAIVNGAIRDAADIDTMPFGVRALGTCPLKSGREGRGEVEVPVYFAGVAFVPGEYLYADADAVLVSEQPLCGEA